MNEGLWRFAVGDRSHSGGSVAAGLTGRGAMVLGRRRGLARVKPYIRGMTWRAQVTANWASLIARRASSRVYSDVGMKSSSP